MLISKYGTCLHFYWLLEWLYETIHFLCPFFYWNVRWFVKILYK